MGNITRQQRVFLLPKEKMIFVRLITILAPLCLALGCASMDDNVGKHVTPSEVIRNTMVGTSLNVSGYLRFSSHERQLWTSKSSYENGIFEKDCLTLLNTGAFRTQLFDLHGQKVTLHGTVRNTTDERIVDLGSCGNFALVVSRIKFAK